MVCIKVVSVDVDLILRSNGQYLRELKLGFRDVQQLFHFRKSHVVHVVSTVQTPAEMEMVRNAIQASAGEPFPISDEDMKNLSADHLKALRISLSQYFVPGEDIAFDTGYVKKQREGWDFEFALFGIKAPTAQRRQELFAVVLSALNLRRVNVGVPVNAIHIALPQSGYSPSAPGKQYFDPAKVSMAATPQVPATTSQRILSATAKPYSPSPQQHVDVMTASMGTPSGQGSPSPPPVSTSPSGSKPAEVASALQVLTEYGLEVSLCLGSADDIKQIAQWIVGTCVEDDTRRRALQTAFATDDGRRVLLHWAKAGLHSAECSDVVVQAMTFLTEGQSDAFASAVKSSSTLRAGPEKLEHILNGAETTTGSDASVSTLMQTPNGSRVVSVEDATMLTNHKVWESLCLDKLIQVTMVNDQTVRIDVRDDLLSRPDKTQLLDTAEDGCMYHGGEVMDIDYSNASQFKFISNSLSRGKAGAIVNKIADRVNLRSDEVLKLSASAKDASVSGILRVVLSGVLDRSRRRHLRRQIADLIHGMQVINDLSAKVERKLPDLAKAHSISIVATAKTSMDDDDDEEDATINVTVMGSAFDVRRWNDHLKLIQTSMSSNATISKQVAR